MMHVRTYYIIKLPAQVANMCACIIPYRQCMHEVFHSFPPPALRKSPPGGESPAVVNDDGDCHMTPQHTVH